MDYTELAHMRAERQHREVAQRIEDIRRDYAETVQQRDMFNPNTERESWDYYDRQAQELESDFMQLAPPEQPQGDPRMKDFVERNKSFFDRNGARAYQAADAAHQYITRQRDPHATNPQHTGMGLDVSSPEYFDRMRDLLQMYGKDFFGIDFDQTAELPTSEEAAKISGLSNKEWNRSLQEMIDQGRMSAQQESAMWGRKVG
jgi:hypothetical protein